MANTISFYQQESQERADALKNDGLAFFKHVRLRIEEEVQRAKAVLPPGSWSGVQRITEKALLGGRLEWLANESERLVAKHGICILSLSSLRPAYRAEEFRNNNRSVSTVL